MEEPGSGSTGKRRGQITCGGLGRRGPNQFVLTAPMMTIWGISQHVREGRRESAPALHQGCVSRNWKLEPLDVFQIIHLTWRRFRPKRKSENGPVVRLICQNLSPLREMPWVTPLVTSRFAPQETCDDVHDPQTHRPLVSFPLVGPLVRRLATGQLLIPSVLCLAPQRSPLPRNRR